MLLYVASSANENIPNKYIEDCEKVLDQIMKNNDLIFGACNLGIMGVSYRSAKKYQREITGICPIAYQESLKDINCDNEIITNEILDSTMTIINKCDAILILPGGFGTVYEIFTSIYSKLCHEHDKPIIIYNACGYYDKLLSFIDDMYNQEFASSKIKDKYFVVNSLDEILNYLENYTK